MDNEVVIVARVEDDSAAGWAKTRAGATKAASDIESDIKKVAPKVGSTLGSGMLSGLTGSLPTLGTFGAKAGVAMTPLLASTVSAAVIGGVGIGVAGLGVVLASKDAQVKAAGANLGKQLMSGLQQDSAGFIGPVLSQIDKIGDAFQKQRGRIKNIFDNSADFLGPLTDGAIEAVDGILRGVETLTEEGGPVIESFGRMFGEVGQSIGDAMETISGGADEAADTIDNLTDILGALIEGTGWVVRGLTELFGAADEAGDKLHDLSADLSGTAEEAGTFQRHVADSDGALSGMEESAGAATKALQELSDEMQAQTDPLFALIDAQNDVTEAQEKYASAVKDSGKESQEAQSALADLGQAAFRLQGRVGAAADGFDGNLTPAMRTALRNAGLSAGQISRLEGELRDAAAAARAWEGTFTQTYKTRIITTRSGEQLSAGGGGRQAPMMASGGIKGAANGAMSSGLTMVGEYGPELVDLPPGAGVKSNPDTQRIMGQGGGSNQPLIVNLVMPNGDVIATAALPSLQKMNRTEYGGDVTQMFPAVR
jgi:ABC-type transporter Mla subunit MlaD